MDMIKAKIREVADWPKIGIGFKDIAPALADSAVFREIIDKMAMPYLSRKIDKVVGIDARGFLLAAPLAYKLNAGLVMVRKKGKLPCEVVSQKYLLEYGSNIIEMHKDSILPNEKTIIIDDVLATGGTIEATVSLVELLKGEIAGVEFLIELAYLKGREKIKRYNVNSQIIYES